MILEGIRVDLRAGADRRFSYGKRRVLSGAAPAHAGRAPAVPPRAG